MLKNKRVVITGMGTINTLGDSLSGYYENLMAGKSGLGYWTSIDVSALDCRVGGDMTGYDFKAALERLKPSLKDNDHSRLRKLFRSASFSNRAAVLSALAAFMDSGMYGCDFDRTRTSVVLAGHNFNSQYIHRNNLQFAKEPSFIDPLCGIEGLDSNIAASVSEILGIHGPVYTVGAACASGTLALREGFRDIMLGECERVVIAGAVLDIAASDIHAMVFLNAVVTDPELQKDPATCSRPFDTRRNGFVPTHGAGAIVIEDLDAARARGATIYAEIIGVKANADGNHLPVPSAESQARLITDLLRECDVAPRDVDYVNCHATSTPLGDLEEIRAIKSAFGSHAYSLKLNAPKSMLGHITWSAAIVEIIGAVLQMNHGALHPSINIDKLDPEIDLDVCANVGQRHQIKCMLKNAFGFGGLNCCALIRRYEG